MGESDAKGVLADARVQLLFAAAQTAVPLAGLGSRLTVVVGLSITLFCCCCVLCVKILERAAESTEEETKGYLQIQNEGVQEAPRQERIVEFVSTRNMPNIQGGRVSFNPFM